MSGTTTRTEAVNLTPIASETGRRMYQLAQDIADQPFPQTPPAGFNEAAYLAANPDVADAVRRGEVRSGFEHYRRFGFSENRPGVGFNEADYLASNPDVAEAVRRGEISSGLEHYRLYGQAEGRQGAGGTITAPFTRDEEAAFQSVRDIAGRAGDIYNQQAAAVGSSILPDAIAQTQGMAGALGGLAGQGAAYLPGLASAAAGGAEIAGQAGQYTPAQQQALTGAQGIAGQSEQILPGMQGALSNARSIANQSEALIPVQGQALSAAQGIAGQAGQFTPAFGTALGAAQDISGQAGQFLPMQAGAAQAAQGIANQAGGLTPIGQQAALTGQNIAAAGTGLLPTTVTGTMGLAQAFPGVNIGAYMNPYTEAVLAPALEDLAERSAIQQNALNSRAAMTGAFGGSRNALAQQEFNRNLLRETGRLSAEQYAKAFDTGTGQFRLDQTNIPRLYEQAFGQLRDAQGLQKGSSELGTAALNQLTAAQGLQRGVADIGTVGLAGLTSAQNMQQTNAQIGQMGLTGLSSALGLQRGVSDIGLQGLDALGKAQGLERGVADIGNVNMDALGRAQGLQRGVADIAQTGLQGLGLSQDLQKGASELGLAGLRGITEQQKQTTAPALLLGQASDLENRRIAQLSGMGAANAGLLAAQTNPLLATGGMQRALTEAERGILDQANTAEQEQQRRNLGTLQNALNIPGERTTTTTTQGPRPNATAQVTGGILSGLTQVPKAIEGVSSLWNTGSNIANWMSAPSALNITADAGGFLFRQGGLVGLNR